MKDIVIEGVRSTHFTPSVYFNGSTGKCTIEGESYLENSVAFYQNLIDWVNQYFKKGGDNFILDVKLSYFNTSSSRAISLLLKAIKKHSDSGKTVKVVWFYPNPDDSDLKAEGEDFIKETGMEMSFTEYDLEEED